MKHILETWDTDRRDVGGPAVWEAAERLGMFKCIENETVVWTGYDGKESGEIDLRLLLKFLTVGKEMSEIEMKKLEKECNGTVYEEMEEYAKLLFKKRYLASRGYAMRDENTVLLREDREFVRKLIMAERKEVEKALESVSSEEKDLYRKLVK
jgi:hypothetical protein